jgi:cyclopropane fatty-acyl-phospholipid synthase-like methyltransferase
MNERKNEPFQQKVFEKIYQTGSDTWTHRSYENIIDEIFDEIENDSLILDLGSGRGSWLTSLVKRGCSGIGIDYVEDIVRGANKKITNEGYSKKGRFIYADIFNMPFKEKSFDVVTDIETFQHTSKRSYASYVQSVSGVLKKNGYYVNVSLSKNTPRFFGFEPKKNNIETFTKFDLNYALFSKEIIKDIFDSQFDILKQYEIEYDAYTEPADRIVLLFSLMKKREL